MIQPHRNTAPPRLRIISFENQKGGVSKSTLTANCAVAAVEQRKRVLILDIDPQGTTTAWHLTREADTPTLAAVTSVQLPEAITRARKDGFDCIFIDTPGRDEPATAAAIRASDICIIPCRPTRPDMTAAEPTISTINRLGKTPFFVITQTLPRGPRIREADNALSMRGVVCPHVMVTRNAYQNAYTAGVGVTEFEPEGKAANEIRALWKWIVQKWRNCHEDDEARIPGCRIAATSA